MDKYERFKKIVEDAAARFLRIDGNKVIRVVSHLDADGLSSAAVLVAALNKINRRYSLSTVHQLDEEFIKQITAEPYEIVCFSDLGSGQFKLIKKHLTAKQVFIFDHHQLEDDAQLDNVIHVNPNIVGINGSKEISGSGVAYLFAKAVDPSNVDIAHVAIMGAVGDVQENRGFERLNAEILEDAKKSGRIKVVTGLRFFGANTRPLHRVLERSYDCPVPGVTGSEAGSIMFLQELGINPKNNGGWRKLIDLSDDELQKLSTAIVLKRLNEEKPEEILGPVYILSKEQKGSPLREVKEFATLLNACGRLGKSSIGIGACLGNETIKKRAIKTLEHYKREISNAIKWYRETQEGIVKGKGYVIINAEDKVRPTIIGTLASIISRSDDVQEGTFILSMAQMISGKTKVSLRYAGAGKDGLNLKEMTSKMASAVDGYGGGHHQAAGALIDTSREREFTENAKRLLESEAIEEKLS